jgi:hypothetical protein
MFGEPLGDKAAAAAALSLSPAAVAATGLPVQIVSCGVPFLFVPLATRSAVDNAIGNAGALEAFLRAAKSVANGVFLFSAQPGGDRATVYSRMFAPQLGVAEDPATGSASGPLGCYLVRHKMVPPDKAGAMLSLQGVKMGRPSQVHISIGVEGGGISSVRVGGESVLAGLHGMPGRCRAGGEVGRWQVAGTTRLRARPAPFRAEDKLNEARNSVSSRGGGAQRQNKGDQHDGAFDWYDSGRGSWPRLRSRRDRCGRVEGEAADTGGSDGAGAAHVQGEVRDEQGELRRRSSPRLGAEGRRPFLQPREEWFLRRWAVLPRRAGLHGAVRDQRRPGDPEELGQRQHPGRSRKADQQEGLHHVRDARAERGPARSLSI